MVPIIICAAIGLLCGCVIWAEDGPLEGTGACIGFTIVGVLCGMFIGLFTGVAAYHGTHWTHRDKNLVSLADGSETQGSFFLGSGYVDGDPTFTWYESDGENNFVRKDASASVSTIHYLPKDATPHLRLSIKKPDQSGLETWGWGVWEAGDEHYDFYVPRGSITHSYRLDNK